jgi:hypothetical protein
LYQTPNPKTNSLAAVSASTTIVVACRAEAERRRVDLARPMAAINTGLQTGGGACEHGLSRLNGFWFAISAGTSLKRGVNCFEWRFTETPYKFA